MSIEVMKQALEALEYNKLDVNKFNMLLSATNALRQAIEQAEKQELVALQMDVIVVNLVREGINKHRARELAEHFIKHTTPQPQREWVGLTQKDIDIAFDDTQEGGGFNEFARAIEAKLREKNQRREKNT